MKLNKPSGMTAQEMQMTTITHTAAQVKSTTQAIFFAALLGLGVVSFVGVLHSQTIHDAAHDLRHASGFPCH